MPPPRGRRRFDDEDDDLPRRRDEDDDRPRRRKPAGSNGLATTALVLGILSFFCSGLTGIPAVICGFLGLSKANQVGAGKGMAIAGMTLGLVGTLVTAIGGFFLTKYSVDNVRNAAVRARVNNDLKEIGLHAHNYHNAYGTFPSPYYRARNPPAEESARLSWRYILLPYAGEDALFKRFADDQAWDSPANRPASDTPVRLYCANEGPGSSQTRYRVFVGGGALFDADPPTPKGGVPQQAWRTKMVDVTDGTSNTIYVVEAGETVPWAQHNELKFDPQRSLPPLGRPERDLFFVLMCDGSTRIVRKGFDQEVFKKMVTRAGGETVQPDW
jgi:hypothetical protein